ncbi:hypothetical protein HYC85_018625 [Camellia sinensis]|uniref:Uncharacterized protein n=1 Tax=Camellia sinensis TaxID=4442 RepID=A0A7J7GYP0_CAMSI|nr:hypothetical protein HYC85_018625 [Camellia sinensis]
MNQNQPGTEPWRELLERSIEFNWERLLRKFHERVPERFLDERFRDVIGGFGQLVLGGLNNIEGLKPETELKALEISCWSVVLHEDSPNVRSDVMRMRMSLRMISMF